MNVKILRFREEHAPRVAEVFTRATDRLRKSKGGLYPDKKIDEWAIWAKDSKEVLEELRKDQIKMLLAELDGKIVGMFGHAPGTLITRGEEIGDRTGFARVRWFFVDPEFQGLGIGRALNDAVIEEARKEGYRHSYAYVILSAHDVYERLGWIHVPEYDSLYDPNKLPFDPELERRAQLICPHIRDIRMDRLRADFFFEKMNL